MWTLTWLNNILVMPKIKFSAFIQQCFANITTCITFGNLIPLSVNRLSKFYILICAG